MHIPQHCRALETEREPPAMPALPSTRRSQRNSEKLLLTQNASLIWRFVLGTTKTSSPPPSSARSHLPSSPSPVPTPESVQYAADWITNVARITTYQTVLVSKQLYPSPQTFVLAQSRLRYRGRQRRPEMSGGEGKGGDYLLTGKIEHRKGSRIQALPETGALPRCFFFR